MTPRRRLGAAVTVVALALGACSGGDGGDPGDGPADAPGGRDGAVVEIGDGCDAVTADDAEDILGEPVQQEEATEGVPAALIVSECVWGAVAQDSFALFQFRAFEGRQFFAPDAFQDSPGFERIDGLGEDAYFSDGTGLNVLEGDLVLTFSVSGTGRGRAEVRDDLVDLAEQVLAGL